LYCGRYLRDKGVLTLLDHAHRYRADHPARFRFVFAGAGEVVIPRAEGVVDLGIISEESKRDLLAGADAVIQLSPYESLSLVALESWTEGTPLIAAAHCAVLAGHIARSGGGRTVTDFESFAHVLDELWHDPEAWRQRGRRGQEYVRQEYGSRPAFLERL